MCGIVGYVGKPPVVSTLLDALARLEYRGYDSAGIAVFNGKGIEVRKRVGKLKELVASVNQRPIEGQLGIGHCLVGDTLIQLADGRVVRIDSLNGETTVMALDPISLKAIPRKARAWSHPAPGHLVEIQVPFGRLICTPQHRLLTVNQDGNLIERKAEELRTGDLLIHARAWNVDGVPLTFQTVQTPRYYRIGNHARQLLLTEIGRLGSRRLVAELAGVSVAAVNHLEEAKRNASESVLRPLATRLNISFPLPDSEPVDSHHGSFVLFPDRSSPDLMQWFGYLLGDGYVGRRSVRFKDADRDTLMTYQTFTKRCFNLDGRVVSIPDVHASLLEINSLGLANWLRVNVLERRQPFLDELGALPQEQIAAFLRGLFDAEGAVGRQAGQLRLSMADIELVRRVQLWLLRLGILASLSYSQAEPKQKRPNPVLHLLLTRRDALLTFRDTIGFSSARKRAWLDQILRTKRHGFYLSSRAIPMSQTSLFERSRAVGVPSSALRPFRGGHRLTDGQAGKFLEVLERFQQASLVAAKVRQWLRSDVRCQEILSVRRIPAQRTLVYDLEVDETENFFANGILSHNSRWATHGEPSEANAHPHLDCHGNLALVHNGIIENYAQLKASLVSQGHRFRSQTDTEVIAHLVEEYAKHAPLADAFRRALKELRGSYAIGLVSKDDREHLYGARCGSPLIVGVGKGEAFLASDVPAVLARTRRVLYLNDQEVVELSTSGVRLTTLTGKSILRKPTVVSWDLSAAQKEGYDHFMLKEIFEQPRAIEHTLVNRLDVARGQATFDRRTRAFLDGLQPKERFVIIACGTAYHAGLVGEYMLEELAKVPVDVDLASEFRYRGPMLDRDTTVIAITQSGETADTLAGVRLAKEHGAKVLAICNVMGASIPREADAVIYTHAGPEIAVASTKAYTSQLTVLYLLTLYLAKARGHIEPSRWRQLATDLGRLPQLVERALATDRIVKQVAKRYASARNFYYLGRHYHFPSALEGALKLKEICPRIHAEGYAAGEMKHGPISLIRKGWPVVFLATDSPVYEKVISNIEEVRARKGECIVIASEGDRHIRRYATHLITVPKTEELFSPTIVAVPLQLLAYHLAKLNKCDIDQPPNLAKSVTVE